MKHIYVVGSAIYSHFKTNKLLLSLFIFGVFTSVVTFIYFYGNMSYTKNFIIEMGENFYTYTVQLSGEKKLDAQNIDWIEKQNYSQIVYFTTLPLSEDVKLDDYDENVEELTIATRRDNIYNLKNYTGRYEFNDDEIKNGENVIIFHVNMVLNDLNRVDTLNQKISIGNTEYTVIGFHNRATYPVIPFQSFVKNALPVSMVEFRVADLLSFDEATAFKEELMQKMPGAMVISPYEKYAEYIDENDTEHWPFIIIVFAVSFLAFMFLMKFLLDSSRYEYVIYSLSGARKSYVIVIMLAQTLILTIFSSLLAVVFHAGFFDLIFERINLYQGLQYNLRDYATIIGLVSFSAFVCALPFMVSYIKNDLISSKNKYK